MNVRGLKIYLFWGKKGAGKSYIMTWLALRLIRKYYYTERRFPNLPKRELWSSMKFTGKLEKEELDKHLFYWENPRQLYNRKNVDIIWDEIGKDLPAASWGDTPKNLKQIFSHLRKRGNRLFANTQTYEDIDVAFRRQVDYSFRIQNIFSTPDISASMPPVKYPFGLIMIDEFDPIEIEHEKNEEKRSYQNWFPKFIWIKKKIIKCFDTQAEIPAYRPDELEHIIYTCHYPDCGKIHIEHKKL